MAEIHVNEGESIESALRRFKKKVMRAGIINEARSRQFYEKPSEERIRKAKTRRKPMY